MRLRHLLLIPALLSSTFAAGEDWTADYEAAKKRAAAEGKDLLIDFTGSDWCAWCIKLRKEVFEQPGFAPAKDKFVLLELDYPKDKSRVSEAVATQNAALIKQYPIKGYPTILLCDASGKPFASTGYQPGGPEKYLPHLDTLLAKKSARDQAIASASSRDDAPRTRISSTTVAPSPSATICRARSAQTSRSAAANRSSETASRPTPDAPLASRTTASFVEQSPSTEIRLNVASTAGRRNPSDSPAASG